LDDARRVYTLVERMRRDTVRSWHVLYLQTGRADDVAFVLQQAFTPNNVTAQPTGNAPGATLGGMQTQQIGGTTGFGGMGTPGSQTGGITAGGTTPGGIGGQAGGVGNTLGGAGGLGANPLAQGGQQTTPGGGGQY